MRRSQVLCAGRKRPGTFVPSFKFIHEPRLIGPFCSANGSHSSCALSALNGYAMRRLEMICADRRQRRNLEPGGDDDL